MLTLLWILLTNIFTGTVLYLVLSLKLEKSADEFRIKKLRREIDETIREFNATAERNISLLENRIRMVNKVLKEGDTSFDSFRVSATGAAPVFPDNSDIRSPNIKNLSPEGTKNRTSFNVVVDEPLDLSVNGSIIEEAAQDQDKVLSEQYVTALSKHDFIAGKYREGVTIDGLVRVSGMSRKEIQLILQLNGLRAEG
ncbi:MAG: hypothetical protein JXN63_08580 [Candidatus Delongbacteria bacterium]|nr:hypothetical protein [Candidatus Delongbacteria bacterium]